MAKIGRPTTYTPEIGDEICRRLMEGESLNRLCADPSLPARSVVLKWYAGEWPRDDPRAEFKDKYDRARAAQYEGYFDRLIEIGEGLERRKESLESEDPNLAKALLHEGVNRDKLLSDNIKWGLARMMPKRYGEQAGGESRPSIDARTQILVESDRELARSVALLLSQVDTSPEPAKQAAELLDVEPDEDDKSPKDVSD